MRSTPGHLAKTLEVRALPLARLSCSAVPCPLAALFAIEIVLLYAMANFAFFAFVQTVFCQGAPSTMPQQMLPGLMIIVGAMGVSGGLLYTIQWGFEGSAVRSYSLSDRQPFPLLLLSHAEEEHRCGRVGLHDEKQGRPIKGRVEANYAQRLLKFLLNSNIVFVVARRSGSFIVKDICKSGRFQITDNRLSRHTFRILYRISGEGKGPAEQQCECEQPTKISKQQPAPQREALCAPALGEGLPGACY
jgi:hypothetical protein